MKDGQVVLLDNVSIEDGSLLDVTVVKTGEQVRVENAEQARRSDPVVACPEFSLVGKPTSSNPLTVFQRLPKGHTAKIRCTGYELRPHLVLTDVQLELAQFALRECSPPKSVLVAMKRLIRERSSMGISPGTKANERARGEILTLLDQLRPSDDDALALWHVTAATILGETASIPVFLSEVPQHIAERELKKTCDKEGHAAEAIRKQVTQDVESSLQLLLSDCVAKAVTRFRRALSGNSDLVRAQKRELSQLKTAFENAAGTTCSK